ncbi:hypothetical protein HPB47_018936, partial [Ixodes persulcatus]
DPKGFGASTNDTESSEHVEHCMVSAERAAPTSVPFLAAQEPFGLGDRKLIDRNIIDIITHSKMAQGKLKKKSAGPKKAKKNAGARSSLKGVSKARSVPKKAKAVTAKQQVKVALEKNIRKNIEADLRARATDEGKPMATSAGTSGGASAAKKRGKKGAKSKKRGVVRPDPFAWSCPGGCTAFSQFSWDFVRRTTPARCCISCAVEGGP